MSKQAKHYIDYAPGLSPDADETPTGQPPTECRVDGDGAKEYLGALRDAQVWPITSCNRMGGGAGGSTIGQSKLREFRLDDATWMLWNGIRVRAPANHRQVMCYPSSRVFASQTTTIRTSASSARASRSTLQNAWTSRETHKQTGCGVCILTDAMPFVALR